MIWCGSCWVSSAQGASPKKFHYLVYCYWFHLFYGLEHEKNFRISIDNDMLPKLNKYPPPYRPIALVWGATWYPASSAGREQAWNGFTLEQGLWLYCWSRWPQGNTKKNSQHDELIAFWWGLITWISDCALSAGKEQVLKKSHITQEKCLLVFLFSVLNHLKYFSWNMRPRDHIEIYKNVHS